MTLGLLFAVFLIGLFLIGISSWKQWSLKTEAPLDVETGLVLPWAGYGSSAVSLSALFGAYSGALLFLGGAVAVGVLGGVCAGLLMVDRRIRRADEKRFHAFLLRRRFASDDRTDIAFWSTLALMQLGLAVSELLLLKAVFQQGLGLSGAHAIAATLSISLVCYFYCLLTGYQAVFRTDAAQYVCVVVMCVFLLATADLNSDSTLATAASFSSTAAFRRYLGLPAHLRQILEVLIGFALGIMPVVAAPDTWKRLFLLRSKPEARWSPWLLLAAAMLPAAGLIPVALSRPAPSLNEFPLQFLFRTSGEIHLAFLLIGMAAVFMSTFDSAMISACHLLLAQRERSGTAGGANVPQFRLVLGGGYLFCVLLSSGLFRSAANPYLVGLFLLGPVGVLVGLLVGMGFFSRILEPAKAVLTASVVVLSLWSYYCLDQILVRKAGLRPDEFFPMVGVGTGIFFLFCAIGRVFSRRIAAEGP